MAKGFTDIAIKNLKAGGVRREIPDSGCAGLYWFCIRQAHGHGLLGTGTSSLRAWV